ncbi:hypothetical protein [Halococcoides cellulosivorans]|nr:hypothetical protein [Halococcoides cellulosivorans]
MILGIPGTGGMPGGPELLLILLVFLIGFVGGPAFVVGYLFGRRSDD